MKKHYNYNQLKIYFKDNFVQLIPVLIKNRNNKDTSYLINYFIDFYKNLLFELNNDIVFVPDSKYTVSIYGELLKKLNHDYTFLSTKLINSKKNYNFIFHLLIDRVYSFLFMKIDIDRSLRFEYMCGEANVKFDDK